MRILREADKMPREEREELIAELLLGLERDREADPGYDEAHSLRSRTQLGAPRLRFTRN